MKAKLIPAMILAAVTLLAQDALTLFGAETALACSRKQEAEVGGGEMASEKQSAPSQIRSTTPPGSARGLVIETMNSGGYTYVLVDTGSEKAWVAVSEFKVAVGDIVTFSTGMPMRNYRSKTLDRTFDVIYFSGNISVGDTGAMGEAAQGIPSGHPDVSAGGADTDFSGIERAAGGVTVAQLYAGKGALEDSEILVRGKVVKVNLNIMGRNWFHLRDGTGGEGTNDLTVTTSDIVEIGQTVLVCGTLAADKNFGSGYKYEVIVERAEVTIE